MDAAASPRVHRGDARGDSLRLEGQGLHRRSRGLRGRAHRVARLPADLVFPLDREEIGTSRLDSSPLASARLGTSRARSPPKTANSLKLPAFVTTCSYSRSMHKPIKYVEKGITVAAKGAWAVFDTLNSIKPNAA